MTMCMRTGAVHRVGGAGGGSEKETTNGRKNSRQAKQSATQPITCLEAAATPYKAGAHGLILVEMDDVRANADQQRAAHQADQLHMMDSIIEQ